MTAVFHSIGPRHHSRTSQQDLFKRLGQVRGTMSPLNSQGTVQYGVPAASPHWNAEFICTGMFQPEAFQ